MNNSINTPENKSPAGTEASPEIIKHLSEIKIGEKLIIKNEQFDGAKSKEVRSLGNYGPEGKIYLCSFECSETPESMIEKFESDIMPLCFVCWDHDVNTTYTITRPPAEVFEIELTIVPIIRFRKCKTIEDVMIKAKETGYFQLQTYSSDNLDFKTLDEGLFAQDHEQEAWIQIDGVWVSAGFLGSNGVQAKDIRELTAGQIEEMVNL